MTAKKVKDDDHESKESKKEESRPVTHVLEVVEVVDESDVEELKKKTDTVESDSPSKDTAKPEKETPLEDEPDDVEVDIDILDEDAAGDSEKPAAQEEQEERRKERKTVESIFSKNDPDTMPEISVHKTGSKSSNRGLYIWAIGMFFMAVTVGAGLLLFSGGGGSLPQVIVQETPTPTPSPSPSPTPTPEPVVKEDLSVQVLNGSGEAGVASTMETFLTDLGYTVDDTGNAENYDYDQTEVSVKKSAEGILSELVADLEDEYVVGSSAADLPEDYEYDVRVIVGAE